MTAPLTPKSRRTIITIVAIAAHVAVAIAAHASSVRWG